MYTVQFSIRKDSLELFSSQDSRDFRNFSLKEKLKEEKYEEAKETMVEV
jgi:flagellar basal body-associated protein FliL